MKQNTLRLLSVGSILAVTAAGCILRYRQIGSGFDSAGLPIKGDLNLILLSAVSIFAAVLSLVLCRTLTPHLHEKGLFRPQIVPLFLELASGLLLMAGAVWSLSEMFSTGIQRNQALLELLQLLAGISVLSAAWLRWKKGASLLLLHAVPCLWQVLILLLNFRNWSMDPTIADYCFRLFALICGMCGCYHIGTFCFGGGRRRMTAFWCLSGVFFTLVGAIGESRSWKMMELGVFLWLLGNAIQIYGETKPDVQDEDADQA